MPRKLSIMRCDLASCRGGLDGCNSSECRNPKWDRVTPEQAKELYGITVRDADALRGGRNKQRSVRASRTTN